MKFTFESRLSDSPFVEAVYHTQSQAGGSFISLADSRWEMVVTRQDGRNRITLRGPETKARPAPVPEDADFLGIIFRLGTYMPNLPTRKIVDFEADLPEAARNAFWLEGVAWQFPTFENADTFINKMARSGLLAREPAVEAVLEGDLKGLSLRSVQRRFVHSTGLTLSEIRQIDRARRALTMLESGTPILDAVDVLGYYDQPHLTKSLRRFMGQTPAQVARFSQPE